MVTTEALHLGLHEAAARLGLSEQALRTYADLGRIESVWLPNGERLFTLRTIQQFLAEHRAIGDEQ